MTSLIDIKHADRQRALGLINGYRVTQAIYVAVTLRIPDMLAEGQMTVAELSRKSGCDPDALGRLMWALSTVDVFAEHDGLYCLTSLGASLRSDEPGSVGAWARFVARPPMWAAWGGLLHTVRTGTNAFKHVNGKDTWDYRSSNPEEAAIFDAAMRENSRSMLDALITADDLGEGQHIVDVGGGDGTLLAGILTRNPALTGALFELPHVAAGAGAVFLREGVADRAKTVEGSFFESVPEGGDIYLLKHVIHDWQDREALIILRACRAACSASSRLVIIERIVGAQSPDAETAFADLNMLVNAGGRERTRDEFEALLRSADFTLISTQRLIGPQHSLMARPAARACT